MTRKHNSLYALMLLACMLLLPLASADWSINTPWSIGPGWNISPTYPITSSAGAGGIITPSGITNVVWGASQSYTLTPLIGYSVSALIVDGVSVSTSSPYTFTNVSATHTITVYFAVNTYTITSSSDTHSSISPEGATVYNYGDSASYSYSADSGYVITSVTVDGSPVAVSSPTGTYSFPSVTSNRTIEVASTAISPVPTPTPSPTPLPSGSTATPEPNPYQHETQTLDLYMRADTYNFSDTSAYGLDIDYTNTYISIPVTSTTTNASITYGVRAYIYTTADEYLELTDGVPDAATTLTSNYTGQISSLLTVPDTTIALGLQALKVDVYAKIDNGSYTLQASFISNPLMTKELMPSTWTVTYNLNMQQLTGNTTAVYTFGDSDHRSGLSGVEIVEPNITDIQGWQWGQGDIIGLIFGSYLTILGSFFWIFIYVAIFGSLWFRHRTVSPVVFIAVLLGGGFTLGLWTLFPGWVAAVVAVLIILGLAAVIFKTIR